MKKINVMVLFGGKSGEHEVSLMSAASILRAINKEKYNIIPVGITKDGTWKKCNTTINEIESGEWEGITNKLLGDDGIDSQVSLIPKDSSGRSIVLGDSIENVDVVFPALHGPYGEDGTIQGLLEIMNIPYVGAGVLASALAMDKAIAKTIFKAENIPQADFEVIYRKKYKQNPIGEIEAIEARINYPVFVKPANLGSSVGISKAKNREQLIAAMEIAAQYDRKIVIEESINAREIECSVLGNDDPIASLPAEIIPSHEFYDYQDKYFDGTTQFIIPADLPEEMIAEVRKLAVRVYKLIDCNGLARVDFFVEKDTNKILINEINTMPGFTKISMYPKMWEATGISYEELINRLIDLAIERFNERN
ncbi:D-alanine--D-alanine ligase [Alkaliphilus peptidifermentans]|uniref:D-alanine--D-alanine ligase n=1 Tax=Alkaliphilus peptidifermentans DSM 18978 TaxID=1120976 RepID=A0A1G5KHE3_9FIRM|nr:D-alanine--D-alanine ligase [Alkaliphilus peptidifermentans]SCZ00022.1 D-alanine--D-alanine ligase [Alkaliphilus peptidifermentans DSM 18978]